MESIHHTCISSEVVHLIFRSSWNISRDSELRQTILKFDTWKKKIFKIDIIVAI